MRLERARAYGAVAVGYALCLGVLVAAVVIVGCIVQALT